MQTANVEPVLFCFGLGYVAEALAAELLSRGWRVHGTTRSSENALRLRTLGITPHLLSPAQPLESALKLFEEVTHILCSIPPDESGDPAAVYAAHFQPSLEWFAYLSTTGVYGDHDGAWVDETTPIDRALLEPRSLRRYEAEQFWLTQHQLRGLPAHIFRIAGIYGPGRSVIDEIRSGTARRIDKSGQVFSRIHRDDIVQALLYSMASPAPGETYNLCDDEPAPAPDVVAYGCQILGVEAPPLIPYEAASLSPMARSFYRANRRVSSKKIKEKLGLQWLYPTYREGLRSLL